MLKRSRSEKFIRYFRLYLSDCLRLFTGEKKVYKWSEITIGYGIFFALFYLCMVAALRWLYQSRCIMDFKSLPLKERADKLWKGGKFLTTASYYGHRISLYSLNGQHIEVWYNAITNEIEDIKPMSKSKLFKKYFEQNWQDRSP